MNSQMSEPKQQEQCSNLANQERSCRDDSEYRRELSMIKFPTKKTKYRRRVATNDQLVEKQYGLSKKELDTLIEQMASTYNYQWKVVSNALYKEHNIVMSDRALNFRYYKLHPRNQKSGYTLQESFLLLKLFFVEGKRYKDINQKFGYRGQHSIRNTLYDYSYRGFSKLQYHLKEQILKMPRDDVIDKRRSRKAFLLQTLILNYGLKWDYNKHALSLFYYFIVAHEQQLSKVPKDLAMLLYMRFSQMIQQKRQQKKQMYELIKPNLYEQLQQVKQQRNRACANMFRTQKTRQKSKSSEGNRNKQQQQDMDDYDIEGISNIQHLNLEESQFEEQELVEQLRSQVQQSLLQQAQSQPNQISFLKQKQASSSILKPSQQPQQNQLQ